ncbi:DUF4440 domain-containing protein [Buttiauxella gaviniae]|uniref:DUF4440 domain-containing protein n=1 Tax=Buttiauxella gaviniae TaxID=82990 RepID=UPI003976401E
MNTIKISAAIILTLAAGQALANPQQCTSVTQADIEQQFERWNSALLTQKSDLVAARYTDDAVLLPTLSNKVRLTKAERIDYFNHFLANKPAGVIDSRTIRLGCNKAIDSGTYTFKFGDGSVAHARYTFTYSWNGKDWLISSHHSSLMPETVG